ncbi:MAG: hypothetical protein JWN40_4019 [Phycisphaerales bacterium]|nr:hypothetical protein [Phycisphaerales bacterium]
MSDPLTIETRLESLEREMAELRRRLNGSGPSGNWLDSIVGSQQNEPAFDEVLKLGREIRSADRPSDNGGA